MISYHVSFTTRTVVINKVFITLYFSYAVYNAHKYHLPLSLDPWGYIVVRKRLETCECKNTDDLFAPWHCFVAKLKFPHYI